MVGHPVRITVDDDLRRSRVTVFFRALLALPHLVWLTLWGVTASLAAVASWLVVLVRGESAESLHRFLAAYVRYHAHVNAFLFLVANPFPGFAGTPGYPIDVAVEPPFRQRRWITLFRPFLAIPALFLSGVLSFVLVVVGLLGSLAGLVTGRMPAGLRNLGAFCIGYVAQADAYWLVVTDAYPRLSQEREPPARPEPV